MMKYKGYTAVVEFDEEVKVFRGEVADTKDVITFESSDANKLEKEFHKSLDEYLKFCTEMKREAEKPFSGKLLLRLDAELHRKLYIKSLQDSASINQLIVNAVREKIENYE